jgi:hypothetical protein
MKKIVSLALSGCSMLFSTAAMAQTYAEEALIFSRINPGGSARIQAMGGSQVALGGDYSSAFSNPAGLGFFNRSEATFSLGTNFYNSTSSYLGTSTSDSKSNFNIPGFSIVFHNDKNKGKLVSGNFAISLSRTNNFNQNFTYQGTNPHNSLIDYFIEQSNGSTPDQFYQNGNSYYNLTRLAFNNYLIGPMSEINKGGDSSQYHTYANQIPFQHERVQVTGAQNQFNVSYGLNFNDFFYLGATVGFPSFNYRSQKTYSESFTSNPKPTPLLGFDLVEDYSIKGSGINTTIGAIIRPEDFIQFGLSVATPTYFYSVADNYNATLTSGWDSYTFIDATYPSHNTVLNGARDSVTQLISNYSLTTPWRIKAGATFFIQKRGLITAEVEKVNYSKSSLSSQTDGLDFTGDNKDIKSLYANVFNIRTGGEYRFGKFRVRAGFSYMPDPYVAIQNKTDNTITSFSGGFGYRTSKFFADLGLIQTQWNSSYNPYTINSIYSPVVTLKNASTSVMVTVGINL